MSESEDSATGEVYEVEWIEKKRIDDKGVEEYFIKWRNYPGLYTLFVLRALTRVKPFAAN